MVMFLVQEAQLFSKAMRVGVVPSAGRMDELPGPRDNLYVEASNPDLCASDSMTAMQPMQVCG